MAGNTTGALFQLITFGESHGAGIGGVIDGCPPGVKVDMDFVNKQMAARRPGQSKITTDRNERDEVQFLSGIVDGHTSGSPIAMFIPNEDQKSRDYDNLKTVYRPSHADYTYQQKYGIRDVRGGGRSSARETAVRVAAGSIATLLLQQYSGLQIDAFVSRIGEVELDKALADIDLLQREKYASRCPDMDTAKRMERTILKAKEAGDSLGGIVTCVVSNMITGLGEPVYDRLEADLAKAMLSINATKGFEIGSGFAGTAMKGSDHNDPFRNVNGKIVTETNNSGGVQGGISNGMDLIFRVAFKPVSTIAQKQKTVDSAGNEADLEAKGRHDPCVVPRAVPVVEAMTALILADHFLKNKIYESLKHDK